MTTLFAIFAFALSTAFDVCLGGLIKNAGNLANYPMSGRAPYNQTPSCAYHQNIAQCLDRKTHESHESHRRYRIMLERTVEAGGASGVSEFSSYQKFWYDPPSQHFNDRDGSQGFCVSLTTEPEEKVTPCDILESSQPDGATWMVTVYENYIGHCPPVSSAHKMTCEDALAQVSHECDQRSLVIPRAEIPPCKSNVRPSSVTAIRSVSVTTPSASRNRQTVSMENAKVQETRQTGFVDAEEQTASRQRTRMSPVSTSTTSTTRIEILLNSPGGSKEPNTKEPPQREPLNTVAFIGIAVVGIIGLLVLVSSISFITLVVVSVCKNRTPIDRNIETSATLKTVVTRHRGYEVTPKRDEDNWEEEGTGNEAISCVGPPELYELSALDPSSSVQH